MADSRQRMSALLEQILVAKRRQIESAKAQAPLESLKDAIAAAGRPRNFFSAVTRKPRSQKLAVIAQIARPPDGSAAKFDLARSAQFCDHAGAVALGVVTDATQFRGQLSDIQAVRSVVKLPVLRYDFLIDPWQIYESRACGADAVVLMASLLRTHELIDLQILATELKLTSLIEVRNIDELMRVRDTVVGFPHRSYSLLGINNRDWDTGEADLGTTLRMLELVSDREVLVSENGLHTRQHVRKLAKAGVRAAMVDESLLRADGSTGRINRIFG
ncbi:MAG: indole-3-glycerol phosphate synthase TrpC [Tepidisphaeraceae bacterium]